MTSEQIYKAALEEIASHLGPGCRGYDEARAALEAAAKVVVDMGPADACDRCDGTGLCCECPRCDGTGRKPK